MRLSPPHRLLLALHRLLLKRVSGRLPGPWADDAHDTARLLVERIRAERGYGAALFVASAECTDLVRLWVRGLDPSGAASRTVRDLRFGLRRLRAKPLRTLSIVLMLSVGVGSSTAIFSIVNNTLLRPMMLSDIDALVRIDDVTADGTQTSNVSPLNAATLTERTTALESVIVQDYRPFVLTGAGEPERLRGAGVSEGFVDGLGVAPVLGRAFTAEEDRAGEDAPSALVGHDLWQRRLGGTADALGRAIVLNGRPVTVVGVMPAGFRFPYEAEVWVPIDYEPTSATPHYLLVFGRVAAGHATEELQRELDGISADLREAAPDANRNVTLRAMPLRDNLVRGYDRTALALLSVVGFLLLVGAVNVASLGLAEAHGRAREMAIRSALGASRARQVAQLLAESATLALLGGAVGLGFAMLLRPLLGLLVPPVMTAELAQDVIALDARVFAFALAASALSALVAGVIPALRAAVRDPARTLRAGGAATRGGRSGAGLMVVGVELALAMVLLTGASAVTASFVRDRARPLGYEAERVLTMRASLPEDRYPGPERRTEFVERLRGRIAAIPGVASSGIGTGNPASGSWVDFAVTPERPDARDAIYVNLRFVTPGVFESLRIPIVAGRVLDDRDRSGPPAAVVSGATARRLWGDEREALGRTILLPSGPVAATEWTVVGIAGDLREQDPVDATVYVPYALHSGRQPAQEIAFFMRSAGHDAAGLAPAVRAAVREIDPDLALFGIQLQTEVRSADIALQRAGATLAAGLVAFGLLLSGIGVFGVVSNVAAGAMRSLGVRKALGAGWARLLTAALVPTARTVAVGLGAGAAAAWAVNRTLAATMPDLPSPDVALYVGAALTLGAVAIGAALGPLVRAARVDAARVLRGD